MPRRKKKERTIEDIIEEIRDLHAQEDDLLSELEEKGQENDLDNDIDYDDEGDE